MAKKKNQKICPFLDSNCLKSQCGLYREDFEKCYIALFADNLFTSRKAIEGLTQALSNFPKSIFAED